MGIAVLDVDSGKLLAAVNEHLALNPASNAKLYTAGAALATLHGEHRYETTLTGRLDGDAVAGPLAIRGFGDPSLSTADLWQMVQELKGFGVKRVDGDVVVDQRFYDEQTTPPAFEQQPNEWASFRAPVSAVALDENCITMTVRPGPVGGAARVEFAPPGFVDAEGRIRTAEGGGADTVDLALSGNGSRMAAKVSGAIAGDSRVVRYTRRAEDPRLLAGYALKALLEKAGVEVKGDVKLGTARGHTLAKHLSEPLSSLLYALGKQSDNFYAEMIFKSLGGEAKARPAKSADSAEVVTRFLDRIGASDTGIVIKNGSGLFDANRVTAYSTVELLRWAWRDPGVAARVRRAALGGGRGRHPPQALPAGAHAPPRARQDRHARRCHRALRVSPPRQRQRDRLPSRSSSTTSAASRTARGTPPTSWSSSSRVMPRTGDARRYWARMTPA